MTGTPFALPVTQTVSLEVPPRPCRQGLRCFHWLLLPTQRPMSARGGRAPRGGGGARAASSAAPAGNREEPGGSASVFLVRRGNLLSAVSVHLFHLILIRLFLFLFPGFCSVSSGSGPRRARGRRYGAGAGVRPSQRFPFQFRGF